MSSSAAPERGARAGRKRPLPLGNFTAVAFEREVQPTQRDLIARGDPDVLERYYDSHAATVHEYCALLCPPDRISEAVLAAFTDLLGRVATAQPDIDLDQLLHSSARVAAASRMDLTGIRDPVCRFVPELIAARTNGELRRAPEAVDKHLAACRFCDATAQRLLDAEETLLGKSAWPPPADVRTAWLDMASRPEPVSGNREPAGRPLAKTIPRKEQPTTVQKEQPTTVRRRRGGVMGAARRVVPSRWR